MIPQSTPSLDKQAVVKMFLRGLTVVETAEFFGCKRTTVERILREAITGLVTLNQQLQTPKTEMVTV